MASPQQISFVYLEADVSGVNSLVLLKWKINNMDSEEVCVPKFMFLDLCDFLFYVISQLVQLDGDNAVA